MALVVPPTVRQAVSPPTEYARFTATTMPGEQQPTRGTGKGYHMGLLSPQIVPRWLPGGTQCGGCTRVRGFACSSSTSGRRGHRAPHRCTRLPGTCRKALRPWNWSLQRPAGRRRERRRPCFVYGFLHPRAWRVPSAISPSSTNIAHSLEP